MLFEPVDQSLDPTPLPIERAIKGTGSALILAPWNGEPDAMCPQVTSNFATAVAFVTNDAVRVEPGTTTMRPLHSPVLHQRLKHSGFVLLSRCEEQRHQLALPLGTQMDFRAETALTAA
jgi:hypothetical protein